MMCHDSMNNIFVLAELFSNFCTYSNMRTFNFVVNCLTYIVKQTGTLCQSNIGTKLTFIKNKAPVKSCTLHPYFSDDLLDQLRDWKNRRNPLIHDLLNQKLGDEDLKNLALDGSRLVRILRTRATAHNRAADKKFGR